MSPRLTLRKRSNPRRHGVIVVLAALMLVVMLGFMAFAIDLGYIQVVRTEAQRCADAAALAGAWEMIGEARLRGDFETCYANARQKAVQFAGLNKAGIVRPALNLNEGNADPQGDIVFGRLDDPRNRSETMSFADMSQYNTVSVKIHCTPERGQQAPLFFARIFGYNQFGVSAEAAATFDDNVTGFRPTSRTPKTSLLPFTVKAADWTRLMAGMEISDNYCVDSETGNIVSGSDGIPEMKMYPADGENGKKHITPGNWGTVDIGNTGNSTADLSRQIREGVNADDLAPHGGTLSLDPQTQTLTLNGDTGISAGMKHALADVVGQARSIPLYCEVTGQGNNTWFTINGFAGVRIVAYDLSGNDKYITIQPAHVCDPAAVTTAGFSGSYFVGQPVHLSR